MIPKNLLNFISKRAAFKLIKRRATIRPFMVHYSGGFSNEDESHLLSLSPLFLQIQKAPSVYSVNNIIIWFAVFVQRCVNHFYLSPSATTAVPPHYPIASGGVDSVTIRQLPILWPWATMPEKHRTKKNGSEKNYTYKFRISIKQ